MSVSTRAAGKGREGEITSLLAEFSRGNRAVETDLAALVYDELRHLASAHMRRERRNHTLQATALVNEAWVRLAGDPNAAWQNRAHFFAIASHHMRRILVDHARKRNATKRGGVKHQITLSDALLVERRGPVDVLALDEAIDRLATVDLRASRIVELHFFAGLSFDEMARVLELSTRTIKREWAMARAWLHNELANSP